MKNINTNENSLIIAGVNAPATNVLRLRIRLRQADQIGLRPLSTSTKR